jgi:nucleoside-diphosphate-sugar epimerase
VPFRQIAEAIGAALGLPVESRPREHFGWFAHFAGSDMAASSARTRALLGWQPQEVSLLSDLGRPEYYAG